MNVKKLREWTGLSGVDFAAKVGISSNLLSHVRSFDMEIFLSSLLVPRLAALRAMI